MFTATGLAIPVKSSCEMTVNNDAVVQKIKNLVSFLLFITVHLREELHAECFENVLYVFGSQNIQQV